MSFIVVFISQMVAHECMYLANYKAGCRIVRLVHNGVLVSLERAFLVDTKDADNSAVQGRKKLIDDFMKNQRLAAKELLVICTSARFLS